MNMTSTLRSVLRRGSRAFVSLVGCSVPLALSGCTTGDKQNELENVAKDWSMVIRASQVIPVYPLTEDVQPGDMFLVDRPINEQQTQYKEKGFLPLDVHVARLQPSGYSDFYKNSFQVGGTDKLVPNHWLSPGQSKDKAWLDAPQAGFPSYKFSVKRGGGLNAALPISGVPVGLTLLGADAADGSITIDKAKTFGIDTISLYRQLVDEWAKRDDAKQFLRDHASTPSKNNYLRVITRVYLTGRMIVQLNSTATSSAGVSVGAAKPVELLTASPNADPKVATAEQYQGNVDKLNTLLEKSLLKTTVAEGVEALLPGATLKVVAASSRSITMAEDFIDRPLIIGYLGFDVLIDQNGRLGLATETRHILEGIAEPPALAFSATEESVIALTRQIQDRPDKDTIARTVAGIIGAPLTTDLTAADPNSSAWGTIGGSIVKYIKSDKPSERDSRLRQVSSALRRALADAGN